MLNGVAQSDILFVTSLFLCSFRALLGYESLGKPTWIIMRQPSSIFNGRDYKSKWVWCIGKHRVVEVVGWSRGQKTMIEIEKFWEIIMLPIDRHCCVLINCCYDVSFSRPEWLTAQKPNWIIGRHLLSMEVGSRGASYGIMDPMDIGGWGPGCQYWIHVQCSYWYVGSVETKAPSELSLWKQGGVILNFGSRCINDDWNIVFLVVK